MQEACSRTTVVHPFDFIASVGQREGLGPMLDASKLKGRVPLV